MLYTVIDISRKLSISRQAVYKKLEKMVELKSHIKVKNNVKYVDEEGLRLIMMSMDDNLTGTQATDDDSSCTSITCYDEFSTMLSGLHDKLSEGYIRTLEEDKKKLFEELQVKNKQIEALTDALNQSQRLNENSQILLKHEQEKNQRLLEASQAPQEVPKSFFARVFKR